jgi:hypothetical protein
VYLGGLIAVGVWLLVRRPVVVAALVAALLVWWELGPDTPVWPWVAAGVWATAHAIGRALRRFVGGAAR